MKWHRITKDSRFPKEKYLIFYDPEPFIEEPREHFDLFYFDGTHFIHYDNYYYSLDDMFNSNYRYYITIKEPQ